MTCLYYYADFYRGDGFAQGYGQDWWIFPRMQLNASTDSLALDQAARQAQHYAQRNNCSCLVQRVYKEVLNGRAETITLFDRLEKYVRSCDEPPLRIFR